MPKFIQENSIKISKKRGLCFFLVEIKYVVKKLSKFKNKPNKIGSKEM
jgi:hypothetical protein